MREVNLDMFIDMIYHDIHENITENVCKKCPIVEYIGEVRQQIKNRTYQQMTSELGVTFSEKKCPCLKN